MLVAAFELTCAALDFKLNFLCRPRSQKGWTILPYRWPNQQFMWMIAFGRLHVCMK